MENQPQNLSEDKKAAVESMFDSIAWRYDFLNHFLSFGIDRLWRRRAIRIISESYKNPHILDVATGTGDLAIAAMKLNPSKIAGIDISQKMLEIGKEKIDKKGFAGKIELMSGDSENIPFGDSVFDVAMVAFGVRNFSDPLKGLSEMNSRNHQVSRSNRFIISISGIFCRFSEDYFQKTRQLTGIYMIQL
jgi:demethylmenaquinone methyltransferase/2-methoxy-6-polyprenyl-1,4-benzoquinol methylase